MRNFINRYPFIVGFCIFLNFSIFIFGCKSKPATRHFRIGFSQCGEADRWRRSMIEEMHRELAFHPDIELIYKQANDNSQEQIKQVEELLDEKIDLLIISPNEAEPLTPAVEQVFSQGIPVIVVDRKTASANYTNYIGADNYQIGKLAGTYTVALLKGKGNIIEIGGLPASSPAIERQRGFDDGLKPYPDVVITHKLNGDWVKPQAKKSLEAIINQLPATNLIFAHNDVMALGAYEVCKAKNETAIKIIGVDALPGKEAGMQFVADKILTASLLYPTGGTEAIRNAALLLDKKRVEKQTILQTLVVDSTNVRMMNLQTGKILSQQVDIEKQQQMLNEQQKLYNSQRSMLYVLGVSLSMVLVFSGLLFYSRIVNRRINRQLAYKNEEVIRKSEELVEMSAKAEAAHEAKLNFFTNISHEFRTPLSLILGPVEEMLQFPKLQSSLKLQLKMVQNNTLRLLRLVNQLIDFRKIEFNKLQVNAVETDLVYFTGNIVGAFKSIAQKRSIDCRMLTAESNLFVWVDRDMMDKILFNLLSNAFKFTEDGGYISISIEKDTKTGTANIYVEDNGIGMAPQEADQAFELFYQASKGNHQGSGLGLPLTKELVQLHHGNITVQSQKNKGSIFSVSLPLGNSHFTKEELAVTEEARQFILDEKEIPVTDFYHIEASDATEQEPEATTEKKVSLLVIEDNMEMRAFLIKRLSQQYEVFEAENGIAGLHQVFEQMPDLVICDVMMPGKDGMMITGQLKKDIRTAHIPVILLTANASEEQQLQGYRTAADAYLTKPFNFNLLEQTITSLLVNRSKMKEHFSSQLPVGTTEKTASKTDRRFITDFIAIVEQNISNEHFAVEDICRELHVSKIQLYRKLKSLLNTNINEYVLNTRIQKAKYYLQHEDLSISEIAFKTGFSSPAYFSTVFKSKTGTTPKTFKVKN